MAYSSPYTAACVSAPAELLAIRVNRFDVHVSIVPGDIAPSNASAFIKIDTLPPWDLPSLLTFQAASVKVTNANDEC